MAGPVRPPFTPVKTPYNPWAIEDPEVEKLKLLQQKAIEDQAAMLQARQANVGNFANFTPMDNLAPLIQLTDQWTGSNMSKAYSAPESAKDRVRMVEALEQGLAQQQNALTDNQLNQLKSAMTEKKADRMQEQQYQMHLDRMANERQVANIKATNATTKEPKITEQQWKAGTFGSRAEAANAIMADLTKSYDPTSFKSALERSKFFPEASVSEFGKQQRQAERDFLTAVLRKESGATITDDELKTGEQIYFDRIGDTENVRKQKANSRLRAIEGLKAEGAPALQKMNDVPIDPINSRTPGGVGQGKPWEKKW